MKLKNENDQKPLITFNRINIKTELIPESKDPMKDRAGR